MYVSLHGVNVTPDADDRIAVFTPAGAPVDSIGTGGTGDGQLNNPGGIDFNPVGDRIRVADTNNNRVQEFDSDGDFVSKLGTAGAGAGQFSFPAGIVFDPAANQFFVADRGNNRIQVFNSAGTFVSEFPAEAPTDLALAALAPTCRADLAVTSFEVFEKDGRDPWFNHFVEGFEHRGRVTVRNNGGDTVGGHVTFFAGDANKGILLRLTAALPKPLASGESATIEFRFETELEFKVYWAIVEIQDGCEDPTSANNTSQDLSVRTLSRVGSKLERISPRISRGLLALFGADSTPTPPKRLTGGVVREASDITRIHL
ncbi:MAG: 6-bladed beta-propeller, partial [Gaiellaceae bacterium]